MTKHISKPTPGPWTISRPNPSKRSFPAWTIKRGRYNTVVTQEADAHLIASAPDLLEALKALVEPRAAHPLGSDALAEALSYCRAQALTAIAKAEGRL